MTVKQTVSRIDTSFADGVIGVVSSVEVSITPGIPTFDVIGLCDSSIRESRGRISAAIRSSGFLMPRGHITVSISPAYVHKSGTSFDFSIALGILFASGQLHNNKYSRIYAAGELSLTGLVKETPGSVLRLTAIKNSNYDVVFIPNNELDSAACAGVGVTVAESLLDAVNMIKSKNVISNQYKLSELVDSDENYTDFSALRGQSKASRAVLIAAAGFHNIILIGSPGSGKSMAGSIIAGLLPKLRTDELCDVYALRNAAGMSSSIDSKSYRRPFRYVHQSYGASKLFGSSVTLKPGELALANKGVLFMDELLEFPPSITDLLRQPMEEHCYRLVKNGVSYVFPSSFMLVGATNPCRCGLLLEPGNKCKCGVAVRRSYSSRISGPFLDRIDIVSEMHLVNQGDLPSTMKIGLAKESPELREKISELWEVQRERNREVNAVGEHNSDVCCENLADLFRADKNVIDCACSIAGKSDLSVRSFQRLLRVGRTIADIAGRRDMNADDVSEAAIYKSRGILAND